MAYAVFDKSVKAKDKCKVPNYNRIKRFKTKKDTKKWIKEKGHTYCRPLKVDSKKKKC